MGLGADQCQELDAKRACTSHDAGPKTFAEKDSCILQKVLALAHTRYVKTDVILPESVMALSDRNAVVRVVVRSLQKILSCE